MRIPLRPKSPVEMSVNSASVSEPDSHTIVGGRYLCPEEVAEGTVEAYDIIDKKSVVIGFNREFRNTSATPSKDVWQAWEFLRRVHHRHLQQVHDVGRVGGTSGYIVLDAVPTGLREWSLGRSWTEISQVLHDGISALAYLSQSGIGTYLCVADIRVGEDGRGLLCGLAKCRYVSHRELGRQEQGLSIVLLELAECIEIPDTVREILQQASAGFSDILCVLQNRDSGPLPIAMAPKIPVVPWHTVGRDAELETVAQWCHSATATERVLWIYGPSGVGRSQLLRELCWRLNETTLSPEVRDWGFLPAILDALAPERQAVFVLIDDVQRFFDSSIAPLEKFLQCPRARHVRFVCTSTEPPPVGLSCVAVELASLPSSAIEEWLKPMGISRTLCKLIARASKGVPARARAIACASELMQFTRRKLSECATTFIELDCLCPMSRRRLAIVATAPEGVSWQTLESVSSEGWLPLIHQCIVAVDAHGARVASHIAPIDIAAALGPELLNWARMLWQDQGTGVAMVAFMECTNKLVAEEPDCFASRSLEGVESDEMAEPQSLATMEHHTELRRALLATGWNPGRAARYLGITRAMCYELLRAGKVSRSMRPPYV